MSTDTTKAHYNKIFRAIMDQRCSQTDFSAKQYHGWRSSGNVLTSEGFISIKFYSEGISPHTLTFLCCAGWEDANLAVCQPANSSDQHSDSTVTDHFKFTCTVGMKCNKKAIFLHASLKDVITKGSIRYNATI